MIGLLRLKHIKTMKCPLCGCAVVIGESIEADQFGHIRTHVNGGQYEHRTFLCGQEVSYTPNYGKDELSDYNICKRGKEYLLYREKRKKAQESLIKYISDLDLVEKDKKKLLSDVHYSLY